MLYRPFGKTGEKVSVLGFGTMRLPVVDHHHDQIDIPLATEMIEYAIGEGVNYIDTAHMYHGTSLTAQGRSEPFTGQVLAGGLRDKVLLATKLPLFGAKTRADMDVTLGRQLEALRTDYIDCYMLHGIGGESWEKFRECDALEFLDKAKADGRIRFAGFSFHGDGPVFPSIVDAYDWDFCQIQYNFMDTGFQAGTTGLRYAAGKGLGVIIMEPIRGGRLARVPEEVQVIWDKAPRKRTPAEWALRWVWNDPEVSLLLSGMGSMEQVKENVRVAGEGASGSLALEELALYDEVRRIYQERTLVECTGCRYCMPCPTGIDIPLIFEIMNDAALYGDEQMEKFHYNMNVDNGGTMKASDCVECGQCVEECPQQIDVPARLAEAAAMFED